eukprot:scpid26148/ scgid8919/ 
MAESTPPLGYASSLTISGIVDRDTSCPVAQRQLGIKRCQRNANDWRGRTAKHGVAVGLSNNNGDNGTGNVSWRALELALYSTQCGYKYHAHIESPVAWLFTLQCMMP